MKNQVLILIAFLLFITSCSKTNTKTIPDPNAQNSTEVNLAIGVKDGTDLSVLFNKINELKFDIKQMSGFHYFSNATKSENQNLIDYFNTKSYINIGAWKATPYSVYFFDNEGKTRVLNILHNINSINQKDWIKTVDSLSLTDMNDGFKVVSLAVPIGEEDYWKEKMKEYSFVKWTETFNQVCISYEHTSVNSANCPILGNVNQNIEIPIEFTIYNGCGGFGNFEEKTNGTTKTIKLNAKYEGCICTQPILKVTTTYNFKVSTKGSHTLKFQQTDGTYLTKNITIQ